MWFILLRVRTGFLKSRPARIAFNLCLQTRTLTATNALAVKLATNVVDIDKQDKAVIKLLNKPKRFWPAAMPVDLRAFLQLKHVPSDQQQALLYN